MFFYFWYDSAWLYLDLVLYYFGKIIDFNEMVVPCYAIDSFVSMSPFGGFVFCDKNIIAYDKFLLESHFFLEKFKIIKTHLKLFMVNSCIEVVHLSLFGVFLWLMIVLLIFDWIIIMKKSKYFLLPILDMDFLILFY